MESKKFNCNNFPCPKRKKVQLQQIQKPQSTQGDAIDPYLNSSNIQPIMFGIFMRKRVNVRNLNSNSDGTGLLSSIYRSKN